MKENLDGKVERKFTEGTIDKTAQEESACSDGLTRKSSRSIKKASQKLDSTEDEAACNDHLTRKLTRGLNENSQNPVQTRL